MIKLDGMTLDLAQENIEKLKGLFPDVFTEGKIDFDKLQQVLGNYIETNPERYDFTWNGKSQALHLAQTPSIGTLRPCKKESKDWDTTENLYIEGDNLEVLKLLQKSYYGKVRMIYIDPPYNTGKDFVYPDKFKDSIENYKAITGQVDSEGNAISSNSETSGRYHTDWLNMIYPRLKLARNLLANDGVIFISIDENEAVNLKKVCDEVFGEENSANEIVWKNSSRNDQDYISMEHEYILCYVKSKSENKGEWLEKKEGLDEIYKAFDEFRKKHGENWGEIHKEALEFYKKYAPSSPIYASKHYTWMDEMGVYFPDNISGPNKGQYVYEVEHPITKKPVKKPSRGWFCPKDKMEMLIQENKIHFGIDEITIPCLKTYLKNTEYRSLNSVIFKDGRIASKGLRALFDEDVFTNPKDEEIIARLISAVGLKDNDIVLDFFSGSATTFHAVIKLNAMDGGKRRSILVQLPENLDVLAQKGEEKAKKTWKRCIRFLNSIQKPHNLCEIGKERIRRAGDKVKEDAGLTAGDLDIGFKVFKLDTSNIRKWQPDSDNIEQSLTDYVDNYVDGRAEIDVVYEIMLKCGLDLTYVIDEHEVSAKKIYAIGYGALMICLADDITTDVAKEMVKLKNELSPETWKVVFKDNGFKSDSDKTNIKEILKCGGLDEDAFTTL